MVGKKLSRAEVAGSAGCGMEDNNLSSKLKSSPAGKRNREHGKGWMGGGGRHIKNSQYMGHGSWEGKLGRVGVWEHGNSVGKGRESKAQEPSRQRGKVGRSRGN